MIQTSLDILVIFGYIGKANSKLKRRWNQMYLLNI